jgi:hypothetical protein
MKTLRTKPNQASLSNAAPRKRNTLQQRLLYTIIPIVLLPLFITGAVEYIYTSNRERDQALERLKENSELMRQGTDIFLNSRLNYSQVLVESPDVFNLFERAAVKASRS